VLVDEVFLVNEPTAVTCTTLLRTLPDGSDEIVTYRHEMLVLRTVMPVEVVLESDHPKPDSR
jgi:hypothetical protein